MKRFRKLCLRCACMCLSLSPCGTGDTLETFSACCLVSFWIRTISGAILQFVIFLCFLMIHSPILGCILVSIMVHVSNTIASVSTQLHDDQLSMICQTLHCCHVPNVLVDVMRGWTSQGKACAPPELAAEEVHQVRGRSLAQIASRLFEISGTLALAHVLHLQVSQLTFQSVHGSHKTLEV
jgi:hypothetical protein